MMKALAEVSHIKTNRLPIGLLTLRSNEPNPRAARPTERTQSVRWRGSRRTKPTRVSRGREVASVPRTDGPRPGRSEVPTERSQSARHDPPRRTKPTSVLPLRGPEVAPKRGAIAPRSLTERSQSALQCGSRRTKPTLVSSPPRERDLGWGGVFAARDDIHKTYRAVPPHPNPPPQGGRRPDAVPKRGGIARRSMTERSQSTRQDLPRRPNEANSPSRRPRAGA